MKQQTFTARITFAWWLQWLYLPGIYTMIAMGAEPDMRKVADMVARAVRIRIVKAAKEIKA